MENGSARANTVTGAQPAAAGANPEEAARLEQQALQASAQPERHKVVRTTNIPGNMNSGINLARMAQFEAGSKLGANTVRPSMQQVMGLSQAQRQQNWGQAAGQNSPAMDIPPLTGESAGGQVFGSPMAAEAAARLPGQPTSAAGQTTPMPGQTMGMNQTPQQPQRIHYTTNIPPKGRNNRQGLIRTLNVDSAGPNSKAGAGIAAYHAQQAQGGGMDELNATAQSLIWEVNRIHSQGAGTSLFDSVQGQQSVSSSTVPLGSAQSVLPNADKLQSGNVTFFFYDKTTGDYLSSGQLDFDSATPGTQNFDPTKNSLQDVADAINNSFPANLSASIQDGKLMINTVSGSNVQFALGTDSTGLMAALGVNTFFTGTDASNIAVDSQLHNDVTYIAAGQVNGQQQINKGDNVTATAIGKLADTAVTISTMWKTTSNQTMAQYYASLVTTVGADSRLAKTNSEYHAALSSDLSEQVSSMTGVNLDEEMANLIKYQHSYTAAAKLITTADQMLQTLLGIKQ